MSTLLQSLKNKIRPHLSVHRHDGSPPLLLSGIPRGGSTWVMEILGSIEGMRMIAEPFNLRVKAIAKELGLKSWDELTNEQNLISLEVYLRKLDSGRLRFLNPNPLTQMRFITSRTVFKIIHLPAHLSQELANRIDGIFLCLVRHPIPVSLSREVFPLLDVFDCSPCRKDYTAEQCRLADHVIAKGSHLEKGALAWCMHYSIHLARYQIESQLDKSLITYEDCLQRPEKTLSTIEDVTALKFPEGIFERASRPSKVLQKSDSATQVVLKGEGEMSAESRTAYLIGRWQDRVSDDEREAVQTILESFGVSLYNAYEPMPLLDAVD